MAHVPERIAAGRFFEEIGSLPCIVGGVGEASGAAAGALFEPLGAPIVQTSPVEAELAKIWTNILRYAMFALPNRLMMECEQYDANVFEVIELINRDYPRGGMPQPGFTAGTCLRKDFTFSEERSPAPGMLLAVSRVHESVPLFIVEGIKRRLGSLRGRKVAVLGLAFKADTDDERDSLSHKLIRLLERELADVAVHDPHVATPTQSFDDAILDADAVVIATNHSEFRGRQVLAAIADSAKGDAVLADPWDCFDTKQVFSRPAELVAARRLSRAERLRNLRRAGTRSAACCARRKRASAPTARSAVAPRDLLALGARAPVVASIGDSSYEARRPGDPQDAWQSTSGSNAEVVADELDPAAQRRRGRPCSPTSMSLIVAFDSSDVRHAASTEAVARRSARRGARADGSPPPQRACRTTTSARPSSSGLQELAARPSHRGRQSPGMPATIWSSEMTLADESPPTAGPASGSAVTSPTWQGTETFAFPATDEGGGVYQAILEVDGAPVLARTIDDWGGRCVDTTAGARVFRYPRPCLTSVDALVAIDANALPAGDHDIALRVSDAAGNLRTVYAARKTIVAPADDRPGARSRARRCERRQRRRCRGRAWARRRRR